MRNATRQVIAGILIYFTAATQVFGQAALLPNAEQQYFDNNGHPLAAGSVDYFVPGTTTRKTTWQNATQTVNNTNPVSLDIGGKSIAYGQGSYRQVVKDSLGNVIWDQPTTAYGASQPSGATGTDTAPVGSVMAYSGFVVPTNWQLAAGQALSRTTFAALMSAITIQATGISCTNTSTTLTGFTDTSTIRVGAPIEATCLPTSTTVASITNATTIVVSNAAAATSSVTATIFPWGNGDQVTTFNVPDLRGRAPVGADCMNFVASGNTCAGNLTTAFYGANPGAGGQKGGAQSQTMAQGNLPNVNFTISGIALNDPGHVHHEVGSAAGGASGHVAAPVNSTSGVDVSTDNTGLATTGITISSQGHAASGGSGTAFSLVNPDATINYIIKVAPNSTGAGGVVSFGGMFGDIVCNSTLTCAPVGSVNTVGCTPATTSQLGCVEPDGVTTKIVGGQLTAIAGTASSVTIGSTTVTGGTNGEILSISSGTLSQVTTTGSGSVVLATSPTLVTPTLGAATATSLNGNTFSGGPYTLTGASGKTFTFNNTLTLAGIDGTTLTFQGTDTYVGRTTTDILTNKTLNCSNNTCTVRLGSDVTGNLPLSNLATGSLDQVIGYFGATTGNAISINNCANALTYSTSTHTFGCNSSAGTGTVTTTGTPIVGQIAQFTSTTAIQGINLVDPPQGRLTLQTNTPVMTTTQSAQTTLRYDCYTGNQVPYYNGSIDQFDTISSCEVTDAMVSAASAGQVVASNVYDVWWVHGGTNRICLAMSASTGGGGGWASDTGGSNTARGTGYSQLDRATRPYTTNKNSITNCFNGATNYGPVSANQGTYLGTVWASANGQISYTFGSAAAGGTAALLGVWNMYNRVTTATAVTDSTSTWTFSSATAAALDGNTNNRISFVTGLAEDGVPASLNYRVALAAVTGASAGLGMGLDSTSTITTGAANLFVNASGGSPQLNLQNQSVFPFPAQLGFHFIQALQQGDGTNTSTGVGGGNGGALTATIRN